MRVEPANAMAGLRSPLPRHEPQRRSANAASSSRPPRRDDFSIFTARRSFRLSAGRQRAPQRRRNTRPPFGCRLCWLPLRQRGAARILFAPSPLPASPSPARASLSLVAWWKTDEENAENRAETGDEMKICVRLLTQPFCDEADAFAINRIESFFFSRLAFFS